MCLLVGRFVGSLSSFVNDFSKSTSQICMNLAQNQKSKKLTIESSWSNFKVKTAILKILKNSSPVV